MVSMRNKKIIIKFSLLSRALRNSFFSLVSLYISEVLKRQEVEDETILALLHKLEEISEVCTLNSVFVLYNTVLDIT